MIDHINKGEYIEPSRDTVADFMEKWLKDSVALQVRRTTLESYTYLTRKHIIPEIGHLPLAKLQPLHIQQLYGKKLNTGRLDGGNGGMSPTSVRRIHSVLHKALATAVKWQLLPRNPADAVDKPRPARKPMQYLKASQVMNFLQTLADNNDTYGPLYLTAIMTGLRRGELLALRWDDLNLDNAMFHIRRSAAKLHDGTIIYQEPKTKEGERSIALPSNVVEALVRHRDRQAEHKAKLKGAYNDEGLIFADEVGGVIDPSNLQRHYKKMLTQSGLPSIRFHDLRHTHATLMLEQGVHPKIVQERLGHNSIQITLDTYSHALPNLQAEAADKLEKALFGDKKRDDDKPDSEKPDGVRETTENYGTGSTMQCVICLA
jgi:integrase